MLFMFSDSTSVCMDDLEQFFVKIIGRSNCYIYCLLLRLNLSNHSVLIRVVLCKLTTRRC